MSMYMHHGQYKYTCSLTNINALEKAKISSKTKKTDVLKVNVKCT